MKGEKISFAFGTIFLFSLSLDPFYHAYWPFQVRTVLSNVSRIEEIVVSDITADGMEDLIVTMDNGTAGGKDIVALSGIGFQVLWIHTVSAGTTLK